MSPLLLGNTQINLVLRSLIRNLAAPNILPLGKIKINFVFTLTYSYICAAYQPLVLGGWQSERFAFGITGQCPRMVCLTQRQC